MLEAGSYLDRVVGDVASSLELRRASAALSRNAAARVDAVETVSTGLVLTGAGAGVGLSLSSVSLSSSELSSSDDDSSFLAGALAGVAGVWFKKRLWKGFFSSTGGGEVTGVVTLVRMGATSAGFGDDSLELSVELSLLVRATAGFTDDDLVCEV